MSVPESRSVIKNQNPVFLHPRPIEWVLNPNRLSDFGPVSFDCRAIWLSVCYRRIGLRQNKPAIKCRQADKIGREVPRMAWNVESNAFMADSGWMEQEKHRIRTCRQRKPTNNDECRRKPLSLQKQCGISTIQANLIVFDLQLPCKRKGRQKSKSTMLRPKQTNHRHGPITLTHEPSITHTVRHRTFQIPHHHRVGHRIGGLHWREQLQKTHRILLHH